MEHKVTYSSCYQCAYDCPITVVSDGPEIVSVAHPECVRASAMVELRETPKRLLKAKIRDNGAEDFRETGWSGAIDHSAKKLKEIVAKYGPDSVAFFVGYTKEVRPYLQRLSYLLGTPHYATECSCCFAASAVASKITLGTEYTVFLASSRGNFPETKCRLVWSNNPTESQLPLKKHHLMTGVDNVPTIVVDPRRSPLAKLAKIHLMLRPGTDGALALGLAHIILKEGLEDKPFLEAHAHGLEDYKSYVQEFSPARTSEITGIPIDKIVAAARLYAGLKPAQITISPTATVHHGNGFQNHRAVILLAALCGNLDVTGGNRPLRPLTDTNITKHNELMDTLPTQIGAEEHPVFTKYYGEGQGMLLADYIESGKIKAVVSVGMNVMMWPNTKRLKAALKSLEFFSVSDYNETPTTELATVVFPAATNLERQSLIVSRNGRVQYRPAAVEPLGEARGDTELAFDLAQALGFGDQFWNGDIHKSFDERLTATGLRFADLPENGKSIMVDLPKVGDRSYEDGGFGTPTGKVEFMSTVLADSGHSPLPIYNEPYWSPISSPELFEEYSLVLTSGGRTANYTHSQGRHLEKLRQREPYPRIQISPEDAKKRSIVDGEWVEVSSPIGLIKMQAWVTNELPEGVVHAFHGWADANINDIIPDKGNDPISGYPTFKSSLCEIRKLRH